MGFWKNLWDDIRPNLLFQVFVSIWTGGIVTAGIVAWILALLDRPVTLADSGIIFLISVALAFVVFITNQIRKHGLGVVAANASGYHSVWLTLLGLGVITLAGWNILLQTRVRHLEVEMIRYVFPRSLTQEQIEKFGEYIREHSKPHEVSIRYVMGDAESETYAQDFYAAFKAGKWDPKQMPINPAKIICREEKNLTPPIMCNSELQEMINNLKGVRIDVRNPIQATALTPEEKANALPSLHEVLTKAFRIADIRGVGASNGSSEQLTQDTIALIIGLRQRDKLAVSPPKDLGDSRQSDYRDEDWN